MLHRLFFLADFLVAKIAKKRERERGNKIARKFSPRTMTIYGSYTFPTPKNGIFLTEREKEKKRERERELAWNLESKN